MNDETAEEQTIAVIGCGLMGSAIARKLAHAGHRVLAWNRTHTRAEALASDQIAPVRDVVEAVQGAELVVACTDHYRTTRSALGRIEAWAGTTFVNLTTGTPADAVEMDRWARERGADYLDGVVIAYPRQIGLSETMVAYSGPASVWSAHEATLMELGGASFHASEQIEGVNLINTGVAGFYIAALGAYVEAATYVRRGGLSTTAMRELTRAALGLLTDTTEEAATSIESGQHETDQAKLSTFLAAMRDQICPAIEATGQQTRIFAATRETLEEADAAGLGGLDVYAQTEVIDGS